MQSGTGVISGIGDDGAENSDHLVEVRISADTENVSPSTTHSILLTFALISLVLYGFALVRQLGESLVARWFPAKMIPLPWAVELEGPSIYLYLEGAHKFDQVHVSVLVSLLMMLGSSPFVIWIGSRWICGKTPCLDRWLAIDSTKKFLALLLASCALLAFFRSRFFWTNFWQFTNVLVLRSRFRSASLAGSSTRRS